MHTKINRRASTTISTAAPTRPSGRRRRRAFASGLLAAAAGAVGCGVAGSTHASASPGGMCFMTPAADGQPLGAYLVGMYRMQDNELQVLYRVECTDHAILYRWVSAASTLGG